MADPAPDIDRFISETTFSGYQRITLPNGRVIPGEDRSPAARLVFGGDLTGKSVLDVGCYYGFFLHEAIRRGAARAVGVEADPERFRIAGTLATQWDGKVEIHEGLLEDVSLDEQFDVVLFLNVIHHVKDPVAVMRRLASFCKPGGTVIVEFRQLHDRQFVRECLHAGAPLSGGRSVVRRARLAVETRLMKWFAGNLPLIGVGGSEYHRTYFFTRSAFRNMFQVHNRIFDSIEFRDSVEDRQALAICRRGSAAP